jgi:hypothetical protein
VEAPGRRPPSGIRTNTPHRWFEREYFNALMGAIAERAHMSEDDLARIRVEVRAT